MVTQFAWSDGLYRPTLSSDQTWEALQVNQLRSQRRFKLSDSFESYLDDPEATFTTSRGNLLLPDIFVSPQMQEHGYDGKSKETFRASELAQRLQHDPHIIIDGPDHAGKTALAKMLVRDVLALGLTPVLLDGKKISEHQEDRVLNGLYRMFEGQYSSDVLEEFKQLPSNKKVLVIDDFPRIKLNPQGRSKLLRVMSKHFTHIVIFSNDFTRRLEEIVVHQEDDFLRGFSSYRLLEFGYALRHEMVAKWIRPEDDCVTSPDMLAQRLRHAKDVLDTVLGRNFIPSYPFFILTILQLIESNTQLDTSAASYGYGYFYEALVYKQLESVTKDLDPSTKTTYLSNLAYHLFKMRIREVSLAQALELHDSYCSDYKRKLDFSKTLEEFHRALILYKTEHTIRFKYGYYYFYFVAIYLRDHITKPEVREDIARMSEKVYKEEFANILLFLTHLSKDPYIIGQMLEKSQMLYAEIDPINLVEDVAFLNQLYDTVPKLVYQERDPEAVRKELAEELDKVSDLSGEEKLEEDLDEQEEQDLATILEINKAYKTIQILGQILKNAPGAIKGDRKLEIAKECYGLGRRLLACLFSLVEKHHEEIVLDLVAVIEKKNPNINRDDLIIKVPRLLFWLAEAVGFGMIKWVTQSIGSEKLEETFKDLRCEDQSVATALIDTSIKLDHINTYPLDDIKVLRKRLDSNLYSFSLLQLLVLYHMDLFYVPREIKQRMCQLVDIKFKELPNPRAIERPFKNKREAA
jgi:hypothetical protein